MGWTFSSDTVSNSSRLWGQDTWKTSGEEGLSYQLILLKKWNPAPEHSASALLTTIDPEQSEEDCEFDLIGDGTGGPGGGGGGMAPPLFQGWHTHFCLMLGKKQWTCQFYRFTIAFHQFWVKNMLVSLLLSLKSTVFACYCPSLFLHFHGRGTAN